MAGAATLYRYKDMKPVLSDPPRKVRPHPVNDPQRRNNKETSCPH
jgi:hypothetical protein